MYARKGASEKTKQELWDKYNELSAYLKKPIADNFKLVPVSNNFYHLSLRKYILSGRKVNGWAVFR